MARTSRFAFLSLLALALVACSAPPPPDPTAELGAIKGLRSSFESAFNSGDAAKLTALYTADAVSMQEHMPPTVGHDAIQAVHPDAWHGRVERHAAGRGNQGAR